MGNEIPQWMAFVQEGRFHEAAQFITASGCMPDIVSRLCRQTCEDFCVLEGAGAPVAISAIERLLTRYALEHELTEPVSPTPNGLRVAVVGSGPSALACCFDLVKAGYALTVFDSHNLPGGMLVQGIPSFQLDKSLVQRRIHQLQQLGVEFRMNIKWGVDVSLSNLCTNYDAVFIGPCAEGAKPLDIPGADSAGVHQTLDFIIQKNFPQALTQVPLDVRGKRVIVLGGGDTAIDGLRTAIRCGAAEATCLYHRQQSDMPCHPRDYLDAAEEGAKFQFSTRATAVLKDSQAKLTVRCVKTLPGPLDQTGRPEPVAQPGSECNLTADVVLVAYGLVAPSIFSDAELHQLKVNEWGGIAVDEWQMTNIPNVFAAGVVVRPSMLLARNRA